MAHCSNCDDPDCQGADHRSEIVIDEDEFRKIIYHIKLGLDDPTNPAKMNIAKVWLKTLTMYDKNTKTEQIGTNPSNPD